VATGTVQRNAFVSDPDCIAPSEQVSAVILITQGTASAAMACASQARLCHKAVTDVIDASRHRQMVWSRGLSLGEAEKEARGRFTARAYLVRLWSALSFRRDFVSAVSDDEPSRPDHLLPPLQATKWMVAARIIKPIASRDQVPV